MLSQSVSASSDRQYIRSGNRFYRQENYAKAEVEYRKALDKNSHNAQAMYNLGCAPAKRFISNFTIAKCW